MAERPDDGRRVGGRSDGGRSHRRRPPDPGRAETAATPVGRRQRQADATRRQLLVAAGEVFERAGYQGATVRAITTTARTAHGTFYLYFENKEDVFCRLLEAVIVDELEVGGHTFLDVGPDRDRLAAAVADFAARFGRHVALWRALLEGVLQSQAVRDLWLDLRGRVVRRLADEMRAQQARGLVRPLDPVAVAHALTSMTEWFVFTQLALHERPARGGGRGRGPGPGLDVVVDTLTDVWLHAVYGRVDARPPPA